MSSPNESSNSFCNVGGRLRMGMSAIRPGQMDVTFVIPQDKGVGSHFRGLQWKSNKELRCVFLGTRGVLWRHHFLFNFYAERKHCFGGLSRAMLACEMEAHVDHDRKTDAETSMPRGNLFLLFSLRHGLSLFMGWTWFS